MKGNKPFRKYRILVTISVLFTTLVVVFGLFFRQFIFWQTSDILLEESKLVFAQVNKELSLSYLATHKAISQTLHILAATTISNATTLEERLSFLPMLKASLIEEPQLTGLQVGYDSGDYFIIRPLRNAFMRKQFSAPENAAFVVDNVTRTEGVQPQLLRLWLSTDLEEISRAAPEAIDYDPRVRPWYVEAIGSESEIVTEPYLFHFIRQMGVTVAYTSPNSKAVIAGDITLYSLSQTLANFQLTPRSELIVLEKKDDTYWVAAYKNPEKLIRIDDDGPKRTKAIELDSEIINYAASLDDIRKPFSSFTYNKETWLGSTRQLELTNKKSLFLVMLSPEDELLQVAKKLQEQTLRYTLVMILLSIPITYLLARKISKPIQTLAQETIRIGRFEFSQREMPSSNIKEVHELGQAMMMMESTIGQFLSLIKSLASEQDFDKLLILIAKETMSASGANAVFTYIVDDTNKILEARTLEIGTTTGPDENILQFLPDFPVQANNILANILNEGKGSIFSLEKIGNVKDLEKAMGLQSPKVYAEPLVNRQGDSIGILCLVYGDDDSIENEKRQGRLAFIEALSGFAAVTLESRKLLKMQKDLLDSFIRLLAGAIDSKSPYTGGHCQRVPVITELLARKACESQDDAFADFSLSDQEWEAIKIASWLHDCGKVTTPEFVVDKATKLETIYDRIHEVRMRFEVLKRDAHIHYWHQLADGGDQTKLHAALEKEWQQLDDEFSFVAECNLGGEFMDQDKIDRLAAIGTRCWKRTLDDRLGISWEELQRKQQIPMATLPVEEPLLADRQDHIFLRSEKDVVSLDKDYGFKLDTPEHLYNKGELYNLSIARGTLTAEERYKINDHIVQSIIMLKQLPYPKHLTEVPDIAGGHHEKIDGTGYPRRLNGDQMSIPAKMMVIADIYEALTASDRPYKKGKTINEAIRIMSFMEKDNHIDSDLFRLFLTSGAYLEYAHEYLRQDQIDEVDVSAYLRT